MWREVFSSGQVVSDLAEEEGRGILTRRTRIGSDRRELRVKPQPPGHFVDLAFHDESHEIQKDGLRLGHRFSRHQFIACFSHLKSAS